MNDCIFCDIWERRAFLNTPSYDTILAETSSFYVVPARGSLVRGYLLVISKTHYLSMAQLTPFEFQELTDLISELLNLEYSKYGMKPIIFEHSAAPNACNLSACCVDHAHLHIVPIKFSSEAKVISNANMKPITSFSNIRDYSQYSYVLYINNSGEAFIAFNEVFPSQYMRKWIANEFRLGDRWDWKQYEFEDNIKATIRDIGNAS